MPQPSQTRRLAPGKAQRARPLIRRSARLKHLRRRSVLEPQGPPHKLSSPLSKTELNRSRNASQRSVLSGLEEISVFDLMEPSDLLPSRLTLRFNMRKMHVCDIGSD